MITLSGKQSTPKTKQNGNLHKLNDVTNTSEAVLKMATESVIIVNKIQQPE